MGSRLEQRASKCACACLVAPPLFRADLQTNLFKQGGKIKARALAQKLSCLTVNKRPWVRVPVGPRFFLPCDTKMRKICIKYQTVKNYFLARFAHSAFYKIHISGAANRHAPVRYAIFFLSSHHDRNPLLYLYHFRKKYNNILAYINRQSSRITFSFFVFIQWAKHFVPVQIL